jgi:hypothetical protein
MTTIWRETEPSGDVIFVIQYFRMEDVRIEITQSWRLCCGCSGLIGVNLRARSGQDGRKGKRMIDKRSRSNDFL